MFGQSLFHICLWCSGNRCSVSALLYLGNRCSVSALLFGQSLFRICLSIWAITVPYLPFYSGIHFALWAVTAMFLLSVWLITIMYFSAVLHPFLINIFLFFFFSDNHCFYPRTQCFLLFICRFLLITVSLLISARAITVLCSGFGSQCFSILAMTAYANAFFFCPLVCFLSHPRANQSITFRKLFYVWKNPRHA